MKTEKRPDANVAELRMARGALGRLGDGLGRYVVTTMPIPWERTKDVLGRRPEKVFMVETMEEEWLEARLNELPACDTVVGIRLMSRPQGNDPEGITTVMQ